MTTDHVLLLRAPSTPDDPYECHFASVGVPSTSLTVLESVPANLDELQWILQTGARFHGYEGVIITSARSVDAWSQAAQRVVSNNGEDFKGV